jgi:bisphosphoglycerate-dependent phosphoglycerate mutase
VKNSKNFLLLITEGALERPFVQKEIIAAVKNEKNIILVHDERSCRFPSGEGLPEEVKKVLAIKAIPYYREKVFRTVCIQQIYNKMVW